MKIDLIWLKKLFISVKHDWTLWEPNFEGSLYQRGRCNKCGLTQEKDV